MQENGNIIEIHNLTKTFGELKAVDDVSFRVKKGELFAFLGVNGAGKSTTISIICGQITKDSGSVMVDGNNIDGNLDIIKSRIGVVFQNSVLDKVLTVRDNLVTRACLYGLNKVQTEKRLNELDELIGLKELFNRPIRALSGGQRRKVDIARALIHNPEILILDEPTTGLDPQTRKTVWNVISELRKNEHTTVFLTTHYMEEAADADYVVILDAGKVVANGTPLELKNKFTGDFISVYNVDEESVKAFNRPYEKIVGGFRIAVKNTEEATSLIISNPKFFTDYEVLKGKMDDVFINATGKKQNEEDKL